MFNLNPKYVYVSQLTELTPLRRLLENWQSLTLSRNLQTCMGPESSLPFPKLSIVEFRLETGQFTNTLFLNKC